MPKALASLPSARARRVSRATPLMESSIPSRNWSSFSFCRLRKGSFISTSLGRRQHRHVVSAMVARRLGLAFFTERRAGSVASPAAAFFTGLLAGALSFLDFGMGSLGGEPYGKSGTNILEKSERES